MILTLKLVGLAYEIQDSKEPETGKLKLNPSVLDVYHYGLCHAGLITGWQYFFSKDNFIKVHFVLPISD